MRPLVEFNLTRLNTRVVVTQGDRDSPILLTVYQGAERLAVVPMDAQRAVALAGDLIEAARTIMDRERR